MSLAREMLSMNPMALPKGTKKVCEICDEPATIIFRECFYYCSQECQHLDYDEGVHDEIREHVEFVRNNTQKLGTQFERQKREQDKFKAKQQIISLASVRASSLSHSGLHHHAIAAATHALKFGIQVHGATSIDLVPMILLLGSANIGINKLNKAETYLSQANYLVSMNPDCGSDLKSKLYRTLGQLYHAKGQAPTSLRFLADDIYYCSLAHGPKDIRSAGGYFLMANIFQATEFVAKTKALYQMVSSIWREQLSRIGGIETEYEKWDKDALASFLEAVNQVMVEYVPAEGPPPLNAAETAEAQQHLDAILTLESADTQNVAIVVRTLATIALLHAILGEHDKAKAFWVNAQKGLEHS